MSLINNILLYETKVKYGWYADGFRATDIYVTNTGVPVEVTHVSTDINAYPYVKNKEYVGVVVRASQFPSLLTPATLS